MWRCFFSSSYCSLLFRMNWLMSFDLLSLVYSFCIIFETVFFLTSSFLSFKMWHSVWKWHFWNRVKTSHFQKLIDEPFHKSVSPKVAWIYSFLDWKKNSWAEIANDLAVSVTSKSKQNLLFKSLQILKRSHQQNGQKNALFSESGANEKCCTTNS